MSQHELFEIKSRPELTTQEQTQLTHLRQKHESASSLGLTAQAKAFATDIATIERGRLLETVPLTDDELTIWRAWMPTTYAETVDEEDEGTLLLSDYSFDRIPAPVLELWQRHKEAGNFQCFEIWSPEEKTVPDPILIGINGHSRHLLARWGESDSNLVSFAGIKRELFARSHKGAGPLEGENRQQYWNRRDSRYADTHNLDFVTFLITLVCGMGLLVSLLAASDSGNSVLYLISLGLLVTILTAWYINRRMTLSIESAHAVQFEKLLLTENPIGQAIGRHNEREATQLAY